MKNKLGQYIDELHRLVTKPHSIMEVCGGQTHAIAALGLENLLPEQLRLVHGPGCPVCVTAVGFIDAAMRLSHEKNVVLCSYGDMMRVLGSAGDLFSARARGGQVELIYSPLDAVKLAANKPEKHIVLFAVGFETTAPATAVALLQAKQLGLKNFSVLCAHVLVPPCLEWLLQMEDGKPDGLLAPGHVCAITGTEEYIDLAHQYQLPIVVTGFEPNDLLRGLVECVRRLEQGDYGVWNAYARCVQRQGNPVAMQAMKKVFSPENRYWRGLGNITNGGLCLCEEWAEYDALKKFCMGDISQEEEKSGGCRAGDVLRGMMKPEQCLHFGKECTPLSPLGAPMVSSEGACAACFRYRNVENPR